MTSSIVHLLPRAQPLADAEMKPLLMIVKAAFAQRRKMIRANLKGLGVDPLALIENADIAPTARAEQLSIDEFAALARAYVALKQS